MSMILAQLTWPFESDRLRGRPHGDAPFRFVVSHPFRTDHEEDEAPSLFIFNNTEEV